MKAVVMAGGEGTRLRPLTCNIPKPMVPVGNRPILEHVLGVLARHGFAEALLTLHHLPGAIRDHFGERWAVTGEDDGESGLSLRYFIEDVPLGTAGSVKNLEPELDQTFLVISGDVLTDIDLTSLVEFHRRQGAAVTIALTTVESPLEYGVVMTDDDGRITRFYEKPSWGEVFSDQVNTGIYVIEPEVLRRIEPGRVFDFSQNLFPLLLEAGQPLFGYRADGYWCDVGNHDQYLQAQVDILEGRTTFDIGGSQLAERVWVGPGVEIAPSVELVGPVLIGPGSYLGTGARLSGPAILGREVVVAGQASVKRSVLGDHSYVGRLSEVRGAVLGRGVRLGNRTRIFDGAVLADEVKVGEGTMVKPNVKVWPGRNVAPETVLGDSLVWAKNWGYGVFGEGGVKGTINVELRPELVARLGAVFGSQLEAGARVVVATDPSAGPNLLGQALVSGLGLAGVHVWHTGELPAAVVRYAVGALGAAGGAHIAGGVKGEAGEGEAAIRLFDRNGLDLPRSVTRRLERALGGEDFRRATPDRLGQSRHLPGLGEAYLAHLGDRGRNLVRRGLTVVGAYDHPWLAENARSFWRGLDVRHVATQEGTLPAVADLVRRESAAFGFVLDAAGEVLRLVDDLGRALTPAQVWLVASRVALIRDDTPLVIPSDLPRAVAERLTALGARPVPCRAARAETMARMLQVEATAGPALFRQSELVYGGLLAAVGLLDHIADTGERLSEMVDSAPLGEWVHLRVECPWEAKGRVMRLLHDVIPANERAAAGTPLEGLQAVTERGRVLVLPDADRPAFHVYSEAGGMELAEELAADFARRVRELATTMSDDA